MDETSGDLISVSEEELKNRIEEDGNEGYEVELTYYWTK